MPGQVFTAGLTEGVCKALSLMDALSCRGSGAMLRPRDFGSSPH